MGLRLVAINPRACRAFWRSATPDRFTRRLHVTLSGMTESEARVKAQGPRLPLAKSLPPSWRRYSSWGGTACGAHASYMGTSGHSFTQGEIDRTYAQLG